MPSPPVWPTYENAFVSEYRVHTETGSEGIGDEDKFGMPYANGYKQWPMVDES